MFPKFHDGIKVFSRLMLNHHNNLLSLMFFLELFIGEPGVFLPVNLVDTLLISDTLLASSI